MATYGSVALLPVRKPKGQGWWRVALPSLGLLSAAALTLMRRSSLGQPVVVALESEDGGGVPRPGSMAFEDWKEGDGLHFLSWTLGDHMVLESAPKSAVVWGRTARRARVTTSARASTGAAYELTTVAGEDGVWRQALPPTAGSKDVSFEFSFASSSGETASLVDVLFGDVFMCSGQSNMQLTLADVGFEEEIAKADLYPQIRLFTARRNGSEAVARDELLPPTQPWMVADRHAVVGGAGTTPKTRHGDYFSAVCWFFGQALADARGTAVGLISNNAPGTVVEQWLPLEGPRGEPASDAGARVFEDLGYEDDALQFVQDWVGEEYNALIHPYTVGPMALSGLAYYQGESTWGGDKRTYGAHLERAIAAWRAGFRDPDLYVGIVTVAARYDTSIREVQRHAAEATGAGWAWTADLGVGGFVGYHPIYKKPVGERLARSARALAFGEDLAWRAPTVSRVAAFRADAATLAATFDLDGLSDAGLTTDVYPMNHWKDTPAGPPSNPKGYFSPDYGLSTYEHEKMSCYPDESDALQDYCGYATLYVDFGGDVGMLPLNATVTATPDGRQLVLAAPRPAALRDSPKADLVASDYAWGAVPMMNAYDRGTGLPVVAWADYAWASSVDAAEDAAAAGHPRLAAELIASVRQGEVRGPPV